MRIVPALLLGLALTGCAAEMADDPAGPGVDTFGDENVAGANQDMQPTGVGLPEAPMPAPGTPGDDNACTPNCTGRLCGPDGCGGSCGRCNAGLVCNVGTGFCGTSLSFTQDVMPMFQRMSCGSGFCHGPNRAGGLDMSTAQKAYDGMVNVPSSQCTNLDMIEPGNPQSSYLINKLLGMNMCLGSKMPKSPASITQAELDTLVAWIQQGAFNN